MPAARWRGRCQCWTARREHPACSLTPGWKPPGEFAACTGSIRRGKSGLVFPAAFSRRNRLHVVQANGGDADGDEGYPSSPTKFARMRVERGRDSCGRSSHIGSRRLESARACGRSIPRGTAPRSLTALRRSTDGALDDDAALLALPASRSAARAMRVVPATNIPACARPRGRQGTRAHSTIWIPTSITRAGGML
jgi:hypothetical protein